MKKILLLALPAFIISCSAQNGKVENVDPMEYANTITASELKDHLYTFASDEFEGRETGEPGQKKAAEYLKNEYKSLDLVSPHWR